jgi:hypothetical protein
MASLNSFYQSAAVLINQVVVGLSHFSGLAMIVLKAGYLNAVRNFGGWPTFAVFAKVGLDEIMPREEPSFRAEVYL